MLLPWFMVLGMAVVWWFAAFAGASSLPSDQFETLSYGQIVQESKALAADYPHLAQVYSAQERYHLPSPGPCSKDDSIMCEQWVLHVSDHLSLEADSERPEVFLSGCLHGDEQVGPNAVLEVAKIMVYAAMCQADSSAKECDHKAFKGTPAAVPWLARLALTRSTVIMPMANPIGYYNVERMENKLDPNRDFPYQQDSSRCMTTIAARSINEVWRDHIFQLAVTFHGGMVAMAYEWGSPNHKKKRNPDGSWQDVSPDHKAQKEVTKRLSRFAGGFKADGKTFEAYPTGRMNELVYAVAGGMEDWAYAGSWDEGVTVCKPKTYGGYPGGKTMYNSATLRALNILVESSAQKGPSKSLLGSRTGLLEDIPRTKEEHANGHVARNVRLSLALVDLVQPYVEWKPSEAFQALETGGANLSDGVARIVNPEKMGSTDLEWTVGGAFRVDVTQLVWGAWPENAESLSPMAWERLVAAAAGAGNCSPDQGGSAKWGAKEGAEGQTIFRERIDLEDGRGGTLVKNEAVDVFVVAIAKVDQSWTNQTLKPSPDVGPQSHFVNARTSDDWFHESAGHVVRGRVLYLSPPLRVPQGAATAASTSASTQSTVMGTVEIKQVTGIDGGTGKTSEGDSRGTTTAPQATWPASSKATTTMTVKQSESVHADEDEARRGVLAVVFVVGILLMLMLVLASVAKAGRGEWGCTFRRSVKPRRSSEFSGRSAGNSDSAVKLSVRANSSSGDLSRRRHHELPGVSAEGGLAQREGLLFESSVNDGSQG